MGNRCIRLTNTPFPPFNHLQNIQDNRVTLVLRFIDRRSLKHLTRQIRRMEKAAAALQASIKAGGANGCVGLLIWFGLVAFDFFNECAPLTCVGFGVSRFSLIICRHSLI